MNVCTIVYPDSVARANLNKSNELVTNTTAASKYSKVASSSPPRLVARHG